MRILAFYDLKGTDECEEMQTRIEANPNKARRYRFALLQKSKGYQRICNAFSGGAQASIVWETISPTLPYLGKRQKADKDHMTIAIEIQKPDIIIVFGSEAVNGLPELKEGVTLIEAPHPELSSRTLDVEILAARDKMLQVIHEQYVEQNKS